jgi:legumain
MAVLTGNSQKVTNRGNGRVLKSGKDDKVFINFVDHGAKGLVAFPFGD